MSIAISEELSSAVLSKNSTSASHDVSATAIQDQIVANLATLRCCESSEIEQELQRGSGDCVIDSHEAVHVIVALERHYGRKLPGQSDLRPHQLTSIASLRSLVQQRLGG